MFPFIIELGTRHLSDTHVFDTSTRVWSPLKILSGSNHPTPRDSHIAAMNQNSMYIFGGSSGSAMNDFYELALPENPTTHQARWRQMKTSGSILARFCHAGVCHGEALYVFGGIFSFVFLEINFRCVILNKKTKANFFCLLPGYSGETRLNDFVKFDLAAYDLTFEIPSSTLLSEFGSLVDNETLSDVSFLVEGTPVFAHKLMLMRSSYFRALFLGEMRESKEKTIRVEQMSHSVFLMVMEYLYTDKVRIPLDSALELFQAADLYCIPRLKIICEKRILQSINVENAATVFYAADLHSASALRQKAKKFILSRFEVISKTSSFEDMGRNNIELVFELLKSR